MTEIYLKNNGDVFIVFRTMDSLVREKAPPSSEFQAPVCYLGIGQERREKRKKKDTHPTISELQQSVFWLQDQKEKDSVVTFCLQLVCTSEFQDAFESRLGSIRGGRECLFSGTSNFGLLHKSDCYINFSETSDSCSVHSVWLAFIIVFSGRMQLVRVVCSYSIFPGTRTSF